MNNTAFYETLLSIYLNKFKELTDSTLPNTYTYAKNYYEENVISLDNLPVIKLDIDKFKNDLSHQMPDGNIPENIIQDMSRQFNDTTIIHSQTAGTLSLLTSAYDIAWLILPQAIVQEQPQTIEIGQKEVDIIPTADSNVYNYIYKIYSIKLTTTKPIISASLLCFVKIDDTDTTNYPYFLSQYIPTNNVSDTTFYIDFTDKIDYTSIGIPLTDNELLNKLDQDYSINKNNFKIFYLTSEKSYNIPQSNSISSLSIPTSSNINYIQITSDYTTNGEDIIGVGNINSPITITLSTNDCNNGRKIVIKDENGMASQYPITIITENGQLIDGETQKIINTNYGSLQLYSNKIKWLTI